MAVGKVVNRFKVAKHFALTIEAGRFDFARDQEAIDQEAFLDGIYVIETTARDPSPEEVVEGYKSLKHVESAFRAMQTIALDLRPIYHRLEDRVRAHAFLCMLSYYVRWHIEKTLRPLRKHDPETYLSFQHVIHRLQAIQLNTVEVQGATFNMVTEPDSQQRLLLEHLGVTQFLPQQTRQLQKD